MLPFTLAFLIIIFFIVKKPGKFTEGGVAVLGLFFLLLLSLVQWEDLPLGIIGTDLLQPFKVVIILISLAVISTTLDDYGFFKYSAYRAILWCKNNGRILFTNFFILTILLTSFTSNDIDVLTVTPIILWFAHITKIKPLPYLFGVFVAANTSSMEFLIGNLTNIIIGTIFDLGFIDFFLIMVLPTILTLLTQYFLLLLIFYKQLPKKILTKKELERFRNSINKPLPNKKKNYFVLIILLLVIVGSALSDFFPIDLWLVTFIGALIILLSNEFNTWERLKAFPWNESVFVVVFMVLTTKLHLLGVIDWIANQFSGALNSIWGGVYIASFSGAIISGFVNNIPTSISLGTAFNALTQYADTATTYAIAYGLVIGTNLGALVSPVGALATIMWLGLIKKKGQEIKLRTFFAYGLIISAASIFVASTIVGLEMWLLFR